MLNNTQQLQQPQSSKNGKNTKKAKRNLNANSNVVRQQQPSDFTYNPSFLINDLIGFNNPSDGCLIPQ